MNVSRTKNYLLKILRIFQLKEDSIRDQPAGISGIGKPINLGDFSVGDRNEIKQKCRSFALSSRDEIKKKLQNKYQIIE